MELFETHPYNFLIKPLERKKVGNELKKLLKLDMQDRRFFTYKFNKIQHKVLIGDIIYFKCEKHHIKLVSASGEMEYVGTLKSEIDKLPECFTMISQSNIINIRHIKECYGTEVLMDNDERLCISKNYRDIFNTKILENSSWGEMKNAFI